MNEADQRAYDEFRKRHALTNENMAPFVAKFIALQNRIFKRLLQPKGATCGIDIEALEKSKCKCVKNES